MGVKQPGMDWGGPNIYKSYVFVLWNPQDSPPACLPVFLPCMQTYTELFISNMYIEVCPCKR